MCSHQNCDGVGTLQALFPDIAAEADGWDPTTVTPGSNQKKSWKCKCGHTWEAKVCDRRKGGCPYCAGKRVIVGQNDLKTLYPKLAAQADGWDPSSVSPGSNKQQAWKCERGHTWTATPCDRTRTELCPFCSGRKVWIGFNDLKTLHPELAAEADGWDPTTLTAGSSLKVGWKCVKGHTWNAPPKDRTPPRSYGCPYCSGNAVWVGFNDLKTLYPEIAAEAHGWDPTTVTASSNQKRQWRCGNGHIWTAVISSRQRNDCPYCGNKLVLASFNDLKTLHPEIARDADGWDPSTVLPGSNMKKPWMCRQGHTWNAMVNERTPPNNTGCPYCTGRKVWVGFNDLKTLYPEIALEADGWDATTVTPGSGQKKRWRCEKGHTWLAPPISRTPPTSSGCPECAETGFNPGKEAFFYLMQRPGEQQFGITNYLEQRKKQHERTGWALLDVAGPFPGRDVQELESALKKWLRKKIGAIERTSENWKTSAMEVRTLRDLKRASGVETDMF